MGILKKYKVEVLLGFVLLVIYLFLRLTNLLHLPIFTDEAIYVRWSQIAAQDASWRFISLTDGKQPLYVWIAMLLMRFMHDPLLAGRLVSVGSGLASVVGMYLLASELFENMWVGFIASFLYIIYPFALVYDRMAMYDSMVATFIIWGIYIEVLLVRRVKAHLAFIAGLIIGGGMLTKTNTFFNIYFLPFTVLLFDFKKEHRTRRLIRWILLAVLTVGLAYLYYSVLRLSPFYGIVNEKNHTFYYPLKEWLQHPLQSFVGNLHGLVGWFLTYFSLAGAALVVASFFVYPKYWKEKILLHIWFVPPFVGFALLAKIEYPRYIFPMTVSLLPLVALTLYAVWQQIQMKYLKYAIIIFFLLIYIRADYFILYDFAHAPIADSDLAQYSNSWPAGGGVNEMVAYFKQQAQNKKIYVASEGTFGSVPTLAMEIYLDKNKNIQKRGIYPIPEKIPGDLLEKAKQMPVYMVFEQTQTPPKAWPLKFVTKYQKGIGNWYMSIYQVTP